MNFEKIFGFSREKIRKEKGRPNDGFDAQALPENPGDESLADEGSPDTKKEIRTIEKRIEELNRYPNADREELATLNTKLDNLRDTLKRGL